MHSVYSRLLRSTMLLSAILYCSGVAQAERYRVFVGTYTGGDSISKGVYSCEFDAETGKLSERVLAA